MLAYESPPHQRPTLSPLAAHQPQALESQRARPLPSQRAIAFCASPSGLHPTVRAAHTLGRSPVMPLLHDLTRDPRSLSSALPPALPSKSTTHDATGRLSGPLDASGPTPLLRSGGWVGRHRPPLSAVQLTPPAWSVLGCRPLPRERGACTRQMSGSACEHGMSMRLRSVLTEPHRDTSSVTRGFDKDHFSLHVSAFATRAPSRAHTPSGSSPPLARPSTTVYVDSMALRFISSDRRALVRITDAQPTAMIDTVSGSIPVDVIGVAGLNVRDRDGRWHHLELPEAHICSEAMVELYPVQMAFAALGARHLFDDVNEIRLADGTRIPFASSADGYPLTVVYGAPVEGARVHRTRRAVAACSALPGGLALVWRRLGYPFNAQWQRALTATEGAFPSSDAKRTKLPDVSRFLEPAVLRGRMKAVPMFNEPLRAVVHAPGSKIYMDGCGPMIPAIRTLNTDYFGGVCAATGYASLYSCRGQSERNATECLARLIAELRMLLRATNYLSPHIVRTDGGSGFIAWHFREFCNLTHQSTVSLSAPYTPQQNSFIERLWQSRFGTARVLLASSNLSARFHEHAVRTANWLHNRLPSLHRGGKSPYELLCGEKPDLSHLRAFGCAVAVWRDPRKRDPRRGYRKLTPDHADFGVYLGPSDEHPAHVVYIATTGKIVVSVYCDFDEASFPGTSNVAATDWGSIIRHELPDADRAEGDVDRPLLPPPNMEDAPEEAEPSPAAYGPLPAPGIPETLPRPDPTDAVCASGAGSVDATRPLSQRRPMRAAHDATRQKVQSSLAQESAKPGYRIVSPDKMPKRQGRSARAPSAAPSSTPAPASRLPPSRPLSPPAPATTRSRALAPASSKTKKGSMLQQAFAALTGPGVAPHRLALHAAPLFAPSAALAYLACVGAAARAALPVPDLNATDLTVPRGYVAAMKGEHADYWREAVHREWSGIMANDSLDFVRRSHMPPGANLMNSHYVFDIKPRPDGSVEKFKARLVADGNTQKYGIDFEQVFATVVRMASIRIVLSIAALNDWGIWQLDIRQAFLQADVQEELYMRMPPNLPSRDEAGNELVCKLKKSLYGLKQAAREWADVLATTLIRFGFRRGTIDTCVYRYDGDHGQVMILLVYVDDIICVYSHEAVRARFVKFVSAELPVDDRGELQWILRMGVERHRAAHAIVLSQTQYVDKLVQRFTPDSSPLREYDSPLDEETSPLTPDQCPEAGSPEHAAMAARRVTYMSAVGALLWLAACTRPDLTYTVSLLARFCSNPGQPHFDAMIRTLGYLSRTRAHVLRLAPQREHEVVVYSDASWLTRSSVSGGIIFYMGCVVVWWSRLQKSVSASTAEAETYAAALASREGIYVRDFLEDIGFGVTRPTPLLLDSKAAIDLAADPVAFKKTKHILRHAYELRDRVARRIYATGFVDSESQLADILTKGLRVHLHRQQLAALLYSPG